MGWTEVLLFSGLYSTSCQTIFQLCSRLILWAVMLRNRYYLPKDPSRSRKCNQTGGNKSWIWIFYFLCVWFSLFSDIRKWKCKEYKVKEVGLFHPFKPFLSLSCQKMPVNKKKKRKINNKLALKLNGSLTSFQRFQPLNVAGVIT